MVSWVDWLRLPGCVMVAPMTRIPLLIAPVVVASFLVAPAASAAQPVRISSVQADSPGPDHGSNTSLNAEWVSIHNYSTSRKNLTGWTLRDVDRHVYKFGTFRLAPGATVRIHTGVGTNTATNRYQDRRAYVWNNDHDTAILRNASGVTVSKKTW